MLVQEEIARLIESAGCRVTGYKNIIGDGQDGALVISAEHRETGEPHDSPGEGDITKSLPRQFEPAKKLNRHEPEIQAGELIRFDVGAVYAWDVRFT